MGLLGFSLFAVLGITAGTLAGLFGIGGGMLIVPGLFYLFHLIQLPEESLIHMAAGTSMSIMICTATASTLAHHAKGHVQWPIFKTIIAGIGIGVISGILLSSRMPEEVIELIFGLFLLTITIKIFLDRKQKTEQETVTPPSITVTNAVGLAIGFKSGVLGIGGGALSVPFLLYCGLPMNQASGTSASFTLPIAVIGTLGFMTITGSDTLIPWSTGYVYWPAFLLVAPFTMMGAPIGAQLSRIVPADRLRWLFALLLLFISLKMLVGTGYLSFS